MLYLISFLISSNTIKNLYLKLWSFQIAFYENIHCHILYFKVNHFFYNFSKTNFTIYIWYCWTLKEFPKSTYNAISHVLPHLIKYNQNYKSQIVKLSKSFLGVPTMLYLMSFFNLKNTIKNYISNCKAFKQLSRSTYNAISHVFPYLIKFYLKYFKLQSSQRAF